MISEEMLLALAEEEKQALGLCLHVPHTLATGSAETAHLHHLHTIAMKFTVFLGFQVVGRGLSSS